MWTYPTGGSVMSPTLYNGIIYFGDSDGYVYALNQDGSLNWSYDTGGAINSQSLEIYDGLIFIGNENAALSVLNLDGTLNWSNTELNAGADSSPTASGGFIYFGDDAGTLYSASSEGIISGIILSSSIRTKPAVHDDMIYVGDDSSTLYAVNTSIDGVLTDESVNWTFAATEAIRGSPEVSDGIIYFGSDDDNLYTVFTNGTPSWAYATGGDVRSPPTVSDGKVYFGSDDGYLYALNLDGTLDWSYSIGSAIQSKPTVANGKVYVGSYNNNMYVFYTNGTLVWSYATTAPVYTNIEVSDGAFYAGSSDYNLYAFHEYAEEFVPAITIFSPANATYNSASIPLDVSSDMAMDTWYWYYDNGAGQTFTPNTTITASEGSNSLTVWANSTYGFWGTASVNFYVDSIKPSIHIFIPQNITYVVANISLMVSASEPIYTWKYDLGAGNYTFTPNTTLVFSEGYNTLTVWAGDIANNFAKDTVSFTVDTAAPLIVITSPLNATYTTQNLNLNVYADETIDKWWYVYGGNTYYFMPNTTFLASLGQSMLAVYANDTSGNVGFDYVIFTVTLPLAPPVKVPLASGTLLAALMGVGIITATLAAGLLAGKDLTIRTLIMLFIAMIVGLALAATLAGVN
jgi:outer membrane protein assembly factor BamB